MSSQFVNIKLLYILDGTFCMYFESEFVSSTFHFLKIGDCELPIPKFGGSHDEIFVVELYQNGIPSL